MSYDLGLTAGRKLAELANEQLRVGEEKYGSCDEYVQRETLEELIAYARERIDVYLKCIEKGKGDPETLLADCENHLRFILAKIEETKSQGS